jgi:hypothetical protein
MCSRPDSDKIHMLALLLLYHALASSFSSAATIYVPTKDYGWEWGQPPASYRDYQNGGYKMRAWLEGQPAPQMENASRALRKEAFRFFELENPVTVRSAVLGPPRSTGGHDPVFYVWIEWVSKSDFYFDLDEHRFQRKAGLARVAIEGTGERKVEIREWHWEKDLKEAELAALIPWDAAVVARKMIDLHHFRPRVKPENVTAEQQHAPW